MNLAQTICSCFLFAISRYLFHVHQKTCHKNMLRLKQFIQIMFPNVMPNFIIIAVHILKSHL